MSSKITAFYAPWCGPCHDLLPKVKDYARRNGISYEEINVDKCDTEQCNVIEYVPSILVDGKPMSDSMLESILDA